MDYGALIFFGILPTVLAIAAVVSSLIVSYKARRVAHFLISALVVAGAAWSLVILYRIFERGAWPTYLPYLIIGILLVIAIAQIVLFRGRDTT